MVVRVVTTLCRATETIGAMLHNRQEIITVEKLRKGVQQQLRKNFTVDYLKQIKTIFPAAYKYVVCRFPLLN
jgi:chromatin licensing and DNA replication factor 1